MAFSLRNPRALIDLKAAFEYLERITEDHPDRKWAWLSSQIDKLIIDVWKKVNTESLVLAASGKEQPPRTATGAPGTRLTKQQLKEQQRQQQSQQQQNTTQQHLV